MLDDWWKKLYPKIYKKPCGTCLVKAKCLNVESWKRPQCDLKDTWRQREYLVETFLNNVEMWFFMILFFIGIALFVSTFGFGIWKWIEIIKHFFS